MNSQAFRIPLIVALLGVTLSTFSQYSITGDATQTINFTSFTGTGFSPGAATTGSLDSNIWGVDLNDDGTMDSDFGDTNTGGIYAGGNVTGQYDLGAWPPGQVRAYTYNVSRLGVRHGRVGDGDIALIMRLQNNTGGDITSLDIAYDMQNRVTTGTSAQVQFYYSADNSTYTEIAAMGVDDGPTTNWGTAADELSGTVTATITNGSFYYLKWVFREHDGNSAGHGIFNIELTATIATGSGEGTITAGTTNFGDLPSTTVADPGEDVFDFTLTDDASAGSDAFPIQFTDVVFTEGASDGIDNWSDVIAGARLEDSGGNFINATAIGTNSITFSGIPITSSDLGYVPDDGSETFTLSVWLNTSISEEIDGDLLHVQVSSVDFTFSGATSTITLTESAASNTSYNTLAVTGTTWGLDNPPNTVGVDEDFTLIVAAMDAYGNVDLDDNSSTFILSRGSTGTNNLTEGSAAKSTLAAKTLTSGRYTYTDLQYDASENFNIDVDDSGGTYLTSITSADITAAISYQSVGSGDWTTDFATIWEFWNGTGWQTATTFPNSATGTIYIRSGNNISVDADITVDQVIIESGGQISMDQNNDNLTIANGPGEDLIVENGGVLALSNYNALPTFTGTIQVQGGGIFSCSVGRFNEIATSTQIDWQTDGVFLFTGGTGFSYNTDYFPAVASGVYPILEVDGLTNIGNSLWTLNGILKASSATLNITNTGIRIRDGIYADGAVTLGNDIDFDGSVLHFGGTGSINLDGEVYNWSGKTIEMVADQEIFNGSISLDGSSVVNGSTFSLNDGTNDNLNLTVADGAIINSDAASGLATTLAIDGTVSMGTDVDYNFAGASQQTLNFGTLGATQAGRVTINNGSGVILNSDLTVIDRLTLTNGIFSTSSSAEVITITNTAAVVGASSTNYFDGPLEIQDVSTSYTFHSGDGSEYKPVIVTPASASDITVEFFSSTPPDNTSVGTGLAAEMGGLYWEIKRGSGSGDVSVELFYKESTSGTTPNNDLIIDGTYLRLIQYNNGTSTWEDLGLDANTSDLANLSSITGTISSFIGTSDYYTIGSEMSNTLLPVELVSFTGHVNNLSVDLQWITASELNNDRFEIQHSIDGIDFKVIGEIAGAGTINRQMTYEHSHTSPNRGANFYRLKQVDFDGQFEYSPVIRVDYQGLGDQLRLLENPVINDQLRFIYDSELLPSVEIIDMTGKVFFQQENAAPGDVYEVDVSLLKAGIYLLRVNEISKRIIIN